MKKFILFLILFLILPHSIYARSNTIEVKFSKCTDGDTAIFNHLNKEIKVRFLAIDTPETTHPTKKDEVYGKEASEYTCNKIKNAAKIELEFDNESDVTDKYNRYLTWVFIDGQNLQFELVEQGYAKIAYIYGNYKYLNELKLLEQKAKTEQLGIWSEYQTKPDYTIYYLIGGTIIFFVLFLITQNTKNKTIKKFTKKASNSLFQKIKKRANKIEPLNPFR